MKYGHITLDIRAIRDELNLSQSEFADLLSVSNRTIQSCEQQWRKPSSSLEKSTLLLLMASRNGKSFAKSCCWKETGCEPGVKQDCIAFRARQGHLCWLLSGTICKGVRLKSWSDKLAICLECDYFQKLLKGALPRLEIKK